MRPLTEKEKRLTVVLLMAVFLVVNLFGLVFLARKRKTLETDLLRLKTERLDAGNWLAEKDLWMERKKWLDVNQPRLKTSGEANANLLEALQTSAEREKIAIVEQVLLEPSAKPHCQEVGVKLRITGSLEAILRWLTELQQPARFHAVTTLSLKTDADPAKMKCELQVVRWYAPQSSP